MKKRVVAVCLLFLLCLYPLFRPPALSTTVAVAQAETFAYVENDTTYFYTSKHENSGLFLLPKTYFVKILAMDGEYYQVEYLYDSEYTQKLIGYVKTADVVLVDFTPQEPYLYYLLDVKYSVDGNDGRQGFLDHITITCAYYGDYVIGSQTYCYVLRGDSFGYIPKPATFLVRENTEYAEYLAEQSTPTPDTNTEKDGAGMSAAQIAILITLCLLVPLLAALVLKTSKRSPYPPEE